MKRTVTALWTLALLQCGGGGGSGADAGPDAPMDAADSWMDAIPADDAAWPDDQVADTAFPDIGPTCETPNPGQLEPPVADPRKFALAVFHFNIQYVAGGLKGLMPPEQDPEGMFDYDNDQLEDRIVRESFEPLLDIFLAHPTFAGDIELQGYMLDVMMDRHPEVVAKMRALVARGQIAIESFHYSDQLFTAHSRWTMERSQALNRRAFERACLPQSRAVFTQEGQFSEGMLERMKFAGQTIGIMKGGLADYQYSGVPQRLLYRLRDQDVVTTRGGGDAGFEVTWYFVGDGETVLTGDLDPYLGSAFRFQQASADALVQKLQQLQNAGYFLTTVEDYVRRLKEAGVEAVELPYSLDGTWRPDDSNNLFAWMGRRGLWGDSEADNEVLATLERSRIALMAADAALLWAVRNGSGPDPDPLREALDPAIRAQVLAEVSDSTGWNPWLGEVRYALEFAQSNLETARDVLEAVRASVGAPWIRVDTASGEVTGLDAAGTPPVEAPADPPFDIEVQASGFDSSVQWTELQPPATPRVLKLVVTLARTESGAANAVLSFPRSGDRLIYGPAMLDEVADLDLSGIPGFQGLVNVPAANGLLGLGNGVFLVKDLRSFHLSAFFPKQEPRVYFEDQTLNGPGPYEFRFFVLIGASAPEALAFARSVNVQPVVEWPSDL